jgi:hypothetical protein
MTIVRRWGSAAAALALVAFASLAGCAHARRQVGVPIEQRPTPAQPPPESANAGSTMAPASPPPAVPAGSLGATMAPAERAQAMQRIVADTTAASAAVKKCATKNLLPDQESVFETTRGYLIQARAALRRDELWQAESLARKARQLALSLECH